MARAARGRAADARRHGQPVEEMTAHKRTPATCRGLASEEAPYLRTAGRFEIKTANRRLPEAASDVWLSADSVVVVVAGGAGQLPGPAPSRAVTRARRHRRRGRPPVRRAGRRWPGWRTTTTSPPPR